MEKYTVQIVCRNTQKVVPIPVEVTAKDADDAAAVAGIKHDDGCYRNWSRGGYDWCGSYAHTVEPGWNIEYDGDHCLYCLFIFDPDRAQRMLLAK